MSLAVVWNDEALQVRHLVRKRVGNRRRVNCETLECGEVAVTIQYGGECSVRRASGHQGQMDELPSMLDEKMPDKFLIWPWYTLA